VRTGRGNADVTEESTDKHSEDENNDDDEKSSSDAVEDHLEVTLVVRSHDERGGLTDKGELGGFGNDGEGLSTLGS
jgi:hypothetical protein